MHKYRKPYRIKRKRLIVKSKFFWIVLLILIFLGTIFYFFSFSPIFQIKEIKISGNQKIQAQEIENYIREKINQKPFFSFKRSIFYVNLKEISVSLLEKYPGAENMDLKRKLPAALIVEVKERSPVAVFCQEEGNCFSLDRSGVIFEQNDPQNHELVIRFKDKIEPFYFGRQVIKENQLLSILQIQEKLKTILKIAPKEYILQNSERVHVKTAEGWEIYFDLGNNVDWQLTKLSLVLEKEIPPEKRGGLEYIDLRFGNFAPYKYR